MYKFRIVKSLAPLLGLISANHGLSYAESDDVVVRLTPQSQKIVKDRLKAMRINDVDAVEDVVVCRNANKSTIASFSPLYGNRVAFRMKGYVSTKQTKNSKSKPLTAGFGSIRGMIEDEVKDGQYAVSMPCSREGQDTKERNITADLPSRVHYSPYYAKFLQDAASGKCNENYFAGNLLKHKASDGSTHDSVSVEVIHLPFEKQIVVDGYLCPKMFVNKETGMCTYERTDGDDEVLLETSEVKSSSTGNIVDTSNQSQQSSVEASTSPSTESSKSEKKCPICAYIENGPCKSEFNDWESCIAALDTNKENASEAPDVAPCYPQTKLMMQCFMKYEYYDIMTAGMHDQMEAAFGSTEAKKTAPAATKESDINIADVAAGLANDMDPSAPK